MLEEIVAGMERKGIPRQSSAPVKSNGAAERKTDPSGRNFNRFSKKRESPGVRVPLPENANRRTFPPKNRLALDKRPRQRGSYGNRQREEVVVTEGREATESLVNPRFAKGNGSHLLNFQYAPRHREVGNYRRPPGLKRKAVKVTYNKERYLQANCQFVVKDCGDYAVQAVDPDSLVDWSLVEQVRTFSHESPSCPICLHLPSAGKITKCGHVFCWSCILHYISMEDDQTSFHPCPICFESIQTSDLRSVRVLERPVHKVGNTITLQLMKRERNSTYAVPSQHWEDRAGQPQNVEDLSNTEFAKVLVATAEQIRSSVLERERIELITQMADADPSEVCFIESAQVYLSEREAVLQGSAQAANANAAALEQLQGVAGGNGNGSKQQARPVPEPRYPTLQQPLKVACRGPKRSRVTPRDYADAFDDLELEDNLSEDEHHGSDMEENSDEAEDAHDADSVISSPRADVEMARSISLPILEHASASCTEPDESGTGSSPPTDEIVSLVPPGRIDEVTMTNEEAIDNLAMPDSTKKNRNLSKKDFYFYQASDGQQIYLHSINARCIEHQYGGLENGPTTITAKIIDKEVAFMTKDIRNRIRYMSHIPLTCEFQVVELELCPPLVAQPTLQLFANEIQQRALRRQRAKRDDKRRERKERIRQQLAQGWFPKLQVPLDSPHHFPAPETETRRRQSSTSDALSSPASSPTELNASAAEFVPRVKSEGALSELSQSTFSFAAAVKHQPAPKPAWGPRSAAQMAKAEPATQTPKHRHDTDESDNEDRVPVPDFHASFQDSIAAKIDAAVAKETVSTEGKGKGGKKKKKEAKLLFSTSMMRR